MEETILTIITGDECLKLFRRKKPVLAVEKGNKIIKVASFNNDEMAKLFIDTLEEYGFKGYVEVKKYGNQGAKV